MLTTRTPQPQLGWVATDDATGAYLLPLTNWQDAQPPRYLLAMPWALRARITKRGRAVLAKCQEGGGNE